MRTRVVLWALVVAFLLVALSVMGTFCTSVGTGATEPTVEQQLQKTEPQPGYPVKKRFEKHGVRRNSLATEEELRAGTVCWVDPDGLNYAWAVDQGFWGRMYSWDVDVSWCARNGKVIRLAYNFCLHKRGYYAYDGCHKDRGGFGYSSLGMHYGWKFHYTLPLLNVTDHRHPEVRIQLGADGSMVGTVWYDAASR